MSFDEVAYFNNEYRGDLIVTVGVLYYFPHTRVSSARFSNEIKGKETVEQIGLIGVVVPFMGFAPWAFELVDKTFKVGKFLRRSFAPTINKARIRQLSLWKGNESSDGLQKNLDEYLVSLRSEPPEFEDDSVPKPMRFAVSEMENVKLGLKLRFDAKFDNHDFRVNLFRRSLLKRALKEAQILG